MRFNRWPSAGSAQLEVRATSATSRAQMQRVGSLPIHIGMADRSSRQPSSPGAHLSVHLLNQSATQSAGVTGIAIAVTRLDASGAPLDMSVDYSTFRNAGGALWADNLHLVTLPGCALTTPSLPACRVQTPVASTNDLGHGRLTARIDPAAPIRLAAQFTPLGESSKPQTATLASTSGATTVLAASAGPSGTNGTFQATPLAPSGSWSATGASGDFDWTYPITTPPVAAGADVAPAVALSYDSGIVDGRLSSTNNQSSWIGEGWDYSPGYIERTYRSCADDTTLPAASQTGDLCWAGQLLTFSLGSRSGPLVRDDTTGTWHPANDDSSRVELIGAGTGGYQGEYWRVTTTDGVQYYFGLNTLPGGASAQHTNSAWTVPVYGGHSGNPCYNATFAQASCTQAWRWNLDYVVDPHGNATAYYYTPEAGYYGADGQTTPVAYTRGGYLTEIHYGLRAENNTIYTVPASGKVVFATAERCTAGPSFCNNNANFTAANASDWPDTPQYLDCTNVSTGGPASTCSINSPSFWTRKQLTAITSQYWTGTTYQSVDSYSLGQSFPTSGDPELELDSITRVAYSADGTTSTTLPAVSFNYQLMDNRISGVNSEPAMQHWRLSAIYTETGEQLTVKYSCGSSPTMNPSDCQSNGAPPLCTASTLPANPAQDTAECFPVYWTPAGYFTTPTLDWFHKYVVTEVDATDANATAPERITTYSYLGSPAWHYDDNDVVPPSQRSYGQFRGYGQVQTRTGNLNTVSNNQSDRQTLSTGTYFRGMNGDTLAHTDTVSLTSGSTSFTDSSATSADVGAAVYGAGIPAGTTVKSFNTSTAKVTLSQAATTTATAEVAFIQTATRSASVTDSLGEVFTDSNQYADLALETQTFNYDRGAEVSATITTPTTVATTATQARSGLPNLVATIVRTAKTRDITDLAAGGSRTHETDSTYDSLGRLTAQTDTGTSLNPACTSNSYADNTTTWIRNRPAETIKYASVCPPANGAATLSDVRHYYDNSTALGTAGATGDETESDTATTNNSGTLHFARTTTAYDTSGRPTATTAYVNAADTTGRTTTTAYTPADGGPLTQVVLTNPAGQTTTNVIDASRGTTTESVDVAGHKTDATYDPLGRLTQTWQPGQNKGTNPATVTYSYQYGPTAPLAVTTKTLVDPGNNTTPGYITSVSIYDAFGTLRQTQTDGVSSAGTPSGIVVKDSYTDSHGWVIATNNRESPTNGTPSTSIVTLDPTNVEDRTQTSYDGAGRPILAQEYNPGVSETTPTWTTQSVYGGDRTTVVPPTGGIEATTITDARGNTTELDQWTTPPTITTGNNITGGTANKTTYAYDPVGQRTAMTTAAGTTLASTWGWTYDLAGRAVSQTDPDTGTTTSNYDDLGELTSSTDAKTQTLAYSYDSLGRKTGEYSGSTSGTQLAGWVYDTLQAGQLTSDTRYLNGNRYTVAATGYDNAGNPTGTRTIVPTTTGLPPVDTTSYTWTTTHLMATQTPAAGGGLPLESASTAPIPGAIDYTYDSFGHPTATTGYTAYVSASTYTPFGEPLQYTLGVNNQTGFLTYSYDLQTRRVSDAKLSAQTAPPQLDDTTYTYDPSGNITKAVETQGDPGNGAYVETNCYTYNSLDQLTQAWSATDACAADPTSSGNATVWGPQPYWDTWTIDAAGNRTQQDQHAVSGSTGDTITTYTVSTTGHAHALTSATTSGAGTTSYTYDNDGNLQSRNLPTGNQTFNWDAENHISNITTSSGNVSYIYDANGNQLIRQDPTAITLYLPGEELTRNLTTGVITGTRYYTHNGVTVAERVGTGNADYLYSDPHGTTEVAVPTNSSGTGTPIRRWFDPYGNPLGNASGAWPDQHAYLNKPADPTTNLDDLGTRNYDPTTGRFIRPDPLLKPNDPQQANGYSYSDNNPNTFTDPSGTMPLCDGPCPQRPSPGSANTGSSSAGSGSDGFFSAGASPADAELAQQTSDQQNTVDQAVQTEQQGINDIYHFNFYDALPGGGMSLSASQQAYLNDQGQCRWEPAYCYAAVDIAMGGSPAEADQLAKNLCASSNGYCDSGATYPDPIASAIQDTIVTFGVGGVLKLGASVLAARLAMNGAETASAAARFTAGADGTVIDQLGGNVPDAISLGKYPAYVNLGAQSGARTFSMSDEAWNAMSPAEQWARNKQFLDQAIARGSQIRLASPLTAENLTGGYGQEIEYLQKLGFTPSSDGTMMLPPGG